MSINYFTNLKNNITTFFNAVKTVISVISVVWNAIKSNLVKVVKAIVDAVNQNFTNMKYNVTKTFNSIKSIVTSVWSSGNENVVDTAVISLKSAVTNTFNAVKSKVTSL